VCVQKGLGVSGNWAEGRQVVGSKDKKRRRIPRVWRKKEREARHIKNGVTGARISNEWDSGLGGTGKGDLVTFFGSVSWGVLRPVGGKGRFGRPEQEIVSGPADCGATGNSREQGGDRFSLS